MVTDSMSFIRFIFIVLEFSIFLTTMDNTTNRPFKLPISIADMIPAENSQNLTLNCARIETHAT